MAYLVTIKMEHEIGSKHDEIFEVRLNKSPTNRQLKFKLNGSLLLGGAASRLSIPWRHIRSVQVSELK